MCSCFVGIVFSIWHKVEQRGGYPGNSITKPFFSHFGYQSKSYIASIVAQILHVGCCEKKKTIQDALNWLLTITVFS